MLDKWFIEDVKKGLDKSDRFVIVDPEGKCGFLIEQLERKKLATILIAHTEIDELKVKYEIEKDYHDQKTIIYTTTLLDDLVWIREYCETGDRLIITYLHRYISEKVNQNLHTELQQTDPNEIIGIGKTSIGRDNKFWKLVIETGEIFSIEEILGFLKSPENKFNSWDKEAQNLFIDFLSQNTEFSLANKPPRSVADELTKALFDHLLSGGDNSFFDDLYRNWVDSKTYEASLKRYVKSYSLPSELDIWNVPSNHPFKEADQQWIKELSENIDDKKWIQSKLPKINERSKEAVLSVLNSSWWEDIHTLFDFDTSGVTRIQSIDDAIDYYKNFFFKVDNAVRHLYTAFLAQKKILKPIQEYYQQLAIQFLDKWFTYFIKQYKENQSGLLKNIVKENDTFLAIIVGDAISFEVSQEIVNRLGSEYKVESNVIHGKYPSSTENCMSRLFSTTDEILSDKNKRQEALLKDTGQTIEFLELDDLSVGYTPNDYTVFYSADMDELSEKQNQGALKYYGEFIENIGDKIDILFGCGYRSVFLVSDHGFVLTGILDEADKIEIEAKGGKKAERYYLAKDKASKLSNNILEIKEPYGESEYQYYSKSMNPFKTRGAYGFSHGGITPQELLIPFLKIEKSLGEYNQLDVSIANKIDLKDVVGDIYELKIQAGELTGDMFSNQRKIILVFVKDKKEFNRSSIITINAGDEKSKEFTFGEYDEFNILVIDAQTMVTLDSCTINRQLARDLGGLGG